MTRRLLALFAPSMLAAQLPSCVETNGKGPCINPMIRLRRPPPNGHCPIPGCGWKAEPFHSKEIVYTVYDKTETVTIQQVDRRIDCERCGCTFRQWAEGKEPKR